MTHRYEMYGWVSSHFSAKLRGYLNYKRVEFQEKDASLYDLLWRIPRGIGVSAMPALRDNRGKWLGDTKLIIPHARS